MSDFSTLGVIEAFVAKLAERSITAATAVQRMVIPPLAEGKSVIFRSATGTGKTFAYLLPALQRLLADGEDAARPAGPQALICAPTFELCSQIKSEIDFLLAGVERAPAVSLLIGSAHLSRQIDALKKTKPLVVVGNPGRILLLAKMGKLKLCSLRYVILDEADRLTAAECREEMNELAGFIVKNIKPRSNTEEEEYRSKTLCNSVPSVVACSATVNAKIKEYLPLLGGAEIMETDEHEILRDRIEHWAIFSESRRKTQMLSSLLAAARPKKALVFTGRSYDAGKILHALQAKSIAAAGLYSGMEKTARKTAVDRFRSGKAAVLVSSDLAARGLDIPGISHVIALDVPANRETYIHRAGRTGRAGKRGIMVSIGDEVEMRRLAALEKKLGIKVYPHELAGGRIFKATD